MATSSQEIIRRTFAPSALVGQIYARKYGSTEASVPIGNVLALTLEHSEDVQKQPDMTRLGGGVHAEMRRVQEVNLSMTLADLNVANFARALMGTVGGTEAGSVTDEAHTVQRGALLKTAHINPTDPVVKLAGVEVPAEGNWERRAAGIYVLPEAADLADGDAITVDYSHDAYAQIEALTTKAAELEITFEGLNEADDGKACVVELWRVSQGVASSIALLQESGFQTLEVSGAVLLDDTRTGEGISRYWRVRKV